MKKKYILSRLHSFSLLIAFLILAYGKSFANLKAFNATQDITVTGQVTDAETNDPVVGANIFAKGTTTGTITDLDGKYSLTVKDDAILVVSFIGYETQEVAVNGQTTLNISLVPSSEQIDDVIVVAYGTVKKSNLTGSAVALSNEELKDVFAPNVANMLQGKIAGVYLQTSSGRPGEAPVINIRGKGSLSNTVKPLWVVDGVIYGNDDPGYSPSDIESITVLKDASATSLYGSLGANGVILVQTKSPGKGVSKISVNASRGITRLNMGNFSLMNSQELYDYHQSWNSNPWFTENLLNTNTDWVDIGTQDGTAQEYNINYTGGTEKISTYISGTFYQEEGALIGYDYEKYSAIANIDMKATDKLTLKANFSGAYYNKMDQEHSTYNMFTYLPWDHPYLPDGTPLHPKLHEDQLTAQGVEWIGRDQSNYLYDLQYNYGKSRDNNLRVNLGFDYKVTDWLTYTSTNNMALSFGHYDSYTDPRSYSGLAERGSVYSYNSFSKKLFTNQLLRFSKTFNEHSLVAFAAWEYHDNYYENSSATGEGVAAGMEVLNTTAEASEVTGYKSESASQNFLISTQYAYSDRYMATASFSRQGSSSFGPNNRYGNFWSASVGWNLHNESFMSSLDWVNVLKLTASFGQIGNAPSGFQYLGYYELTGQYNGYSAARPYQKGNPDISWEKVTSYNYAINTRLFNRVGINLDVYKRDSKDLLAYVPLPAMTGYSGVWMNVGRVVNKGYELAITPEIIKTENFGWDMNINIAYNKNEVLELYEGEPYTSGSIRKEEGYDMDSWYQRIWYGVNPGNGMPLYEQVVENEDGTTTTNLVNQHADATLQHTGKKATPTYTGGIVNHIRAYDFTLTASFGFVTGIHLYNSSRELFDSDGNYPTFNQMNLADGWSRWEKPGDIATHPVARDGGVDANKNSTRYLEDASYFRLRNITLSYTLPQNILKYAKISKASVYLSGDNLLTFSKWSGMDPETGNLYPLTKKFLAGIRIDF